LLALQLSVSSALFAGSSNQFSRSVSRCEYGSRFRAVTEQHLTAGALVVSVLGQQLVSLAAAQTLIRSFQFLVKQLGNGSYAAQLLFYLAPTGLLVVFRSGAISAQVVNL
jgi:hypothetical protein